jgi:hypothetical protein
MAFHVQERSPVLYIMIFVISIVENLYLKIFPLGLNTTAEGGGGGGI